MNRPITIVFMGGPAQDEILELDKAPKRIFWGSGIEEHEYRAIQVSTAERIVMYGWHGPVDKLPEADGQSVRPQP